MSKPKVLGAPLVLHAPSVPGGNEALCRPLGSLGDVYIATTAGAITCSKCRAKAANLDLQIHDAALQLVEGTCTVWPSVHSNGTGRDALLSQYGYALDAVRKAIESVQQNGPHGRDYYPQGGDAVSTALKEHLARVTKLNSVLSDLEVIFDHVADS